MKARRIADGVYYTGVIDWDRRTFDELVALPRGTSYNSYIVSGSSATALIDSAEPSKSSEFLGIIGEMETDIDYIISQHAEQDHSGTIPALLDIYPDAEVLGTPACIELLRELLRIDGNFRAIEDGETLSLGDRTLRFIVTPWVHWPDTMVTYLEEDGILFTCDFFGSHLATSDIMGVPDGFLREARRYYAHIMMPFSQMVTSNLRKISSLDISLIAPSHGPLVPTPDLIIDAYRRWTSGGSKTVIAYTTMHGSTAIMVERLTEKLMELGVSVRPINVAESDTGEFLTELVDASFLVVASPTVLTRPHPAVASALYLVNALRPPVKHVALMGSYGWGTLIESEVKGLLSNLNVEYLEPVLVKGLPREEDLQRIDELAIQIKEIGGELNGK